MKEDTQIQTPINSKIDPHTTHAATYPPPYKPVLPTLMCSGCLLCLSLCTNTIHFLDMPLCTNIINFLEHIRERIFNFDLQEKYDPGEGNMSSLLCLYLLFIHIFCNVYASSLGVDAPTPFLKLKSLYGLSYEVPLFDSSCYDSHRLCCMLTMILRCCLPFLEAASIIHWRRFVKMNDSARQKINHTTVKKMKDVLSKRDGGIA